MLFKIFEFLLASHGPLRDFVNCDVSRYACPQHAGTVTLQRRMLLVITSVQAEFLEESYTSVQAESLPPTAGRRRGLCDQSVQTL